MKIKQAILLIAFISFLYACNIDGDPIEYPVEKNLNIELSKSASRSFNTATDLQLKLNFELSGDIDYAFNCIPQGNDIYEYLVLPGNYTLSVNYYFDNLTTSKQLISIDIEVGLYEITNISVNLGQIDVPQNTCPIIDPDTDLAGIKEKIVGQWLGTVDTPWNNPYSVEFSFREDGTYSGRALSSGNDNGYINPALYWGTDVDSEYKIYDIYDVYSNGSAVGNIEIYFGQSPTNVTTNRGKMDYIVFSNDSQQVNFEVMKGEYGPLVYELHRQ